MDRLTISIRTPPPPLSPIMYFIHTFVNVRQLEFFLFNTKCKRELVKDDKANEGTVTFNQLCTCVVDPNTLYLDPDTEI